MASVRGGVQCRVVGGNVGRGLNVVQQGQHLALLHPIAFLHVEMGDLGERVGADVDVDLGLDLARRGNDGGQIFADNLAGLNGNDAFVALLDGESDNGQQNHDDNSN